MADEQDKPTPEQLTQLQLRVLELEKQLKQLGDQDALKKTIKELLIDNPAERGFKTPIVNAQELHAKHFDLWDWLFK